MKKILVLGSGLVGKTIILDLNERYSVVAADIQKENLERIQTINNEIQTVQFDFTNEKELISLVKDFDLVVGAVPGFMGFKTIERVIKTGKDIVDISFFPEDPFLLNDLARENNVTAIVDCGVAPGLGNIILGYYDTIMDVTDYSCMVGGLPVVREWPYEYKAPFSPSDVIEEYVRPARFVQNGQIISREALSDPELIEFEKIGTLEAWNTDGLRTLLTTMKIPNMVEKTLRYPHTGQYLKALKETGFFSTDEIELNGNKVKPLDLTSEILFKKWKLEEGDEEFTVMRIDIKGVQAESKKHITYSLLDHYDTQTKTTSMARTTGYTCTAAIDLILNKRFDKKGVIAPEFLGRREENLNFILNHLAKKGVDIQVNANNF